MDESWRRTMGSSLPRRRSADHHGGGNQSLAAADFQDVFGGPPRTVLLRHFYGETDHSPAGRQPLYSTDAFCRRPRDGRGLAPAVVPTEQGFFDDIFGARDHLRSRSRTKSKSNSSSVLSSEEAACPGFCRAPPPFGGHGDAALSSFASKLRPITIPSRPYDSSLPSTMSTRGDYQSSFTCSTAAYPTSRNGFRGRGNSSAASSAVESSTAHHRHHHRASSGFCCFTSAPETTSLEPSFRQARRTSSPADTAEYSQMDYGYYHYHSPTSVVSSSVFANALPTTPCGRREELVVEVRQRAPLVVEDDDIDSVGAAAVDEAIAWAKETFWSQMNKDE